MRKKYIITFRKRNDREIYGQKIVDAYTSRQAKFYFLNILNKGNIYSITDIRLKHL